jgi:hypothetical protein
MSPPPIKEAAAVTTKDHDGFVDGVAIVKRSPHDATSHIGGKDAFVQKVHRIEVAAAMLLLDELPRTKRPTAPAATLKHIAERRWPTIHGYVSEQHLIDAAHRLEIPVSGGDIAVRLPRFRRRKLHQGGRRK